MDCSDKHIAYVCTNPECGSLLAPAHELRSVATAGRDVAGASNPAHRTKYVCRYCNPSGGEGMGGGANGGGNGGSTSRGAGGGGGGARPPTAKSHSCEPVALPYVFRYLTNELAGMNIRITLKMDNWEP